MSSLQKLHDVYLKTRPATRKVQTTSQLLIRLCRTLNMDGPQDITPEYYAQLPAVIDGYCNGNVHKAIQDKSTLAEMIGRYGPSDGWEKALDILLKDKDQNLRQFVLQSMEYITRRQPENIIPYIEKFIDGDDALLTDVAARLISRSISEAHKDFFEKCIDDWESRRQFDFLALVKKNMAVYIRRADEFTKDVFYKSVYDRLTRVLLENH